MHVPGKDQSLPIEGGLQIPQVPEDKKPLLHSFMPRQTQDKTSVSTQGVPDLKDAQGSIFSSLYYRTSHQINPYAVPARSFRAMGASDRTDA